MSTFGEFIGGIVNDIAKAGAEIRRKGLRERFPEASDATLDHILELEDDIKKAGVRERWLRHERDELEGKVGRYDSDLNLEELSRRKALAELRLLELKIEKMEGTA